MEKKPLVKSMSISKNNKKSCK